MRQIRALRYSRQPPIPPGPDLATPRALTLISGRVADLESRFSGASDEASINVIKRDLRFWQKRQITAELAPSPTGETVEIGTAVTFLLNGKQRALSIVGNDEAEPAKDLIAFSAPLTRALMGGEPGEALPFNGQEDTIEIVSISVTP